MRNEAPFKWTRDRVAELIRLWGDGASATQIAKQWGGGCTRNAVIGKIHRLRKAGIELRSAANLRELPTKPPRPKRERVYRAPAVAAIPHKPRLEVVPPTAKPWTERKAGECNWPIAGEGADTISCCRPSAGRWCEEHNAIGCIAPQTDAKRLFRILRRAVTA